MRPIPKNYAIALVLLILTDGLCIGDPIATIHVQVDKPGVKISPTMWGIFFEDINFAADGGLYGELVKNRSFEFPNAMTGWAKIERGGARGSLSVMDRDPLNAVNHHYLRINVDSPGEGYGVSNEGFRGIGVRKDEGFAFSIDVRSLKNSPLLRIELATPDGRKLGSAQVSGFSDSWQKYQAVLQVSATEEKARLNIYVDSPGTLDIDMVSLFPVDSWKNRPGGLRADIAQMLVDLKPGVVRFPGGNIVNGKSLSTRYQWKTTIGDSAARRPLISYWNSAFSWRPTPDYFQSFGLGFFEYFQLCEDLGAEPLPIINCGIASQFDTGELAPVDQLGPYIQDTLDLIEFANGPASSTWGQKRAEMGHPEPFNMKMLGIGNEQWGPQYIERYVRFSKAIKDKYPDMTLVFSAGPPKPGDDRVKFDWGKALELKADVVDEHIYQNPEWFFKNATRYDSYDRNGPKVFVGEYAAQSVGIGRTENRSNWECALSEAAFMTGMERNADVVVMSSYAPLFAEKDAWQWMPDLIWFDTLNDYGTPSYYVQQIFSRNRGDVILPTTISPAQPPDQVQKLYVASSRDATTGEVIVKVVNAMTQTAETSIRLAGVTGAVSSTAAMTTLAGATLQDENSFANPKKISPVSSIVDNAGPAFTFSFKPLSVTVLRIGVAAN